MKILRCYVNVHCYCFGVVVVTDVEVIYGQHDRDTEQVSEGWPSSFAVHLFKVRTDIPCRSCGCYSDSSASNASAATRVV